MRIVVSGRLTCRALGGVALGAAVLGCGGGPGPKVPAAEEGCEAPGAGPLPTFRGAEELSAAYGGVRAPVIAEVDGLPTYFVSAFDSYGGEDDMRVDRVTWDGTAASRRSSFSDPARFPYLGGCLAHGSDLDEDGAVELAGAWSTSSGGASGVVVMDPTLEDPLASALIEIRSDEDYARMGSSCAVLDGYLLVGSMLLDGWHGGFYAFDRLGPGEHGVEAAAASFVSDREDERAAAVLAEVGDQDGDGLADVVVAGYGGVYLLGVADIEAAAALADLPYTRDVVVNLPDAISKTGDLTGDGLDDWAAEWSTGEYNPETIEPIYGIKVFSSLEAVATVEDPEAENLASLGGMWAGDRGALLYDYTAAGGANEARVLYGPLCGVVDAGLGTALDLGGADYSSGHFAWSQEARLLAFLTSVDEQGQVSFHEVD